MRTHAVALGLIYRAKELQEICAGPRIRAGFRNICAGHKDTSAVPMALSVLYTSSGELCTGPHKDTSMVPVLYRESSDLLPALRRI